MTIESVLNRVVFRVHSSPEELLSAQLDVPADEIDSLGGLLVDGGEDEVPIVDAMASIRETGIYGYADVPKLTIHYWRDASRCDDAAMGWFLAHEYAHCVYPHLSLEANEDLREELWAEAVGAIYDLVRQIMGRPAGPGEERG